MQEKSPAIPCNAQGMFNGSSGSGNARYLRLPLISCAFSMSFTGGNGGGYADTLIRVNPLDCDAIFGGQTGGGHASAAPPASPLDCGFFLGTDGGGHANTGLPVSQLNCASFFGTRGSGHDNLPIIDAIDNTGADLVWIGEKDRNWFDPENWAGCNIIPTCARNVIIAPATFNPLISAPNAACHNITIQTGALLEIATTRNLDVCGHWTNQGDLLADINSSVTLVGTADQWVTGDCKVPNAFAELVVNKPSGKVRLADTVQVLDSLWLRSGLLVTNDRVLILQASGTAALKAGYGATSYVHGNFRRYLLPTGEYTFPVGDTLMGYELARVNFIEATSIQYLTARFDRFAALPAYNDPTAECGGTGYDGDMLDNGYWTIDAHPAAQAATGRYHMHLHNVGYTNDRSAFTVVRRPTGTGGTGGWSLNGTCDASSVASLVTRQGMQGFSEFATAQSDVLFPLDKLQLTAAAATDHIRLNWLSEAEVPTGRFELLRGESPDQLQLIASKEVTEQAPELIFAHDDYQVRRGVSYYYQVLRVDADGGGKLSNLAHAILPKVQQFAYSVYPNPANTEVHVALASDEAKQVRIHVTNQLGQTLYDDRVWVDEQQSRHTIRMADWAVGVYYITLSNGKELDTIKLVKLSQ